MAESHTPNLDPIPLMRQLARMASIPEGLCRRMVLVLEVGDVPKLYTEGFLDENKTEELIPTVLEVSEQPVVVNTTTMQNEKWLTYGAS